ncbi:hypothetical protein I307_05588 [Cryptococcus deuterogattii 99/473]|uniref:Chromatin modification-related protein EAF6 n=1 Tax=Cryptococcus deuterogattii Ram5 TaxID=1296110 RepID=A0A0D0UT98_9TREE|nr:hypothetical protein I309_03605 [Cryptococcus deuterogattii LA55]KIR32273.1 hypothetical protein I352_05509 [Cryptococcus deuterogattii MMRL2647]KIR38431.1 hypothetical protein I313_05539 [Cryptococcus deuterogattii Ram5]KIR70417.1 hypothetical protein I310_05663 [Cryptococcus deuterogattii CA1014]KIR90379.1 hypothetical protein I304_05959 [Cryptococcus deuterogattii CBS 10090]KIR97066.1 hypothetical protein L804_05728 [Cryptococcus deuterogattii 2001/935-1]KIY55050.1 hypothetical protein 
MSTSGPPADAKKAQTAAMAELEAALKKKKAIESTLVTLENSIYNFEGSYLDETAASGGNIIKHTRIRRNSMSLKPIGYSAVVARHINKLVRLKFKMPWIAYKLQ